MAEAQAQVIIRTVADLRAHAITTWLQPITVCIPIPEGDALKVNLELQGSLPVSLYLYELALLMKEATTAGGRKWWFRQVREPSGSARQAKFDASVLFVCPHFRGIYKKQETTGQNESAAQAMINMLDCRKRENGDVNWMCLFIDYSPEAERLMAEGEEESIKFDSMTMQTCTGETASLAVNDPAPPANNSWLQGLSKFFEDQWSGVVGMMKRPAEGLSQAPSAPAKKPANKKNPWLPHDRKIHMNGKTVLLLALLWCTTQEQLLFAKFPEIAGHDTKAQVCSTNAPWYYCVGYRENFHTYIIMRGLVNNESLAMFMFITHVAWPYLHSKKVLRCIRAHISDGKDEQLRALASMCLLDGDSPNAKVLRCAWHIVNRAMYRIFGSASRDWQRAFEKIFWIWQGVETVDALKAFYDWIMSSFFTSPVILGDMTPSDMSKVDSFLGGIWATRNEWSVAHNLEVQAFDLRVNTFTEAQFSVLTQHVGVSANMSAPTFVRAEDLVQLHRQNKLMFQNFKQATRSYSHASKAKAKEWFAFVEDFLCPKPLQMSKQEVELASECLRSAKTSVMICCADSCPTCSKYMTRRQHQLKEMSPETITIHAKCHTLDKKKNVTFASLPIEFQNVIRKAPKEGKKLACCDLPQVPRWLAGPVLLRMVNAQHDVLFALFHGTSIVHEF